MSTHRTRTLLTGSKRAWLSIQASWSSGCSKMTTTSKRVSTVLSYDFKSSSQHRASYTASVDTYEPKLKEEVTSKAVTVDDGDLPF